MHNRNTVDLIFADQIPYCECGKLIKPDIVFFGEQLPDKFFLKRKTDLAECDLLLVMGTSLKVHPFAGLVDLVSDSCVRLLINRELVGDDIFYGRGFNWKGSNNYRDLPVLGDIDENVFRFVDLLGWKVGNYQRQDYSTLYMLLSTLLFFKKYKSFVGRLGCVDR